MMNNFIHLYFGACQCQISLLLQKLIKQCRVVPTPNHSTFLQTNCLFTWKALTIETMETNCFLTQGKVFAWLLEDFWYAYLFYKKFNFFLNNYHFYLFFNFFICVSHDFFKKCKTYEPNQNQQSIVHKRSMYVLSIWKYNLKSIMLHSFLEFPTNIYFL